MKKYILLFTLLTPIILGSCVKDRVYYQTKTQSFFVEAPNMVWKQMGTKGSSNFGFFFEKNMIEIDRETVRNGSVMVYEQVVIGNVVEYRALPYSSFILDQKYGKVEVHFNFSYTLGMLVIECKENTLETYSPGNKMFKIVIIK